MGGINTDGAFAEYMVVDSKTAVLLPDNLSFEQAAPLTCAGQPDLPFSRKYS